MKKRPKGRPKSREALESLQTTLPREMKNWLFASGGPAFILRKLIGDAMKAEKSE